MGYHKEAAEDILEELFISKTKPELVLMRALTHAMLALCEAWEGLSVVVAVPEAEEDEEDE